MFEVVLAVGVTGILFIVAGLPFASASRSADEGWIAYLTDAAAYGVAFLSLVIAGWAWLGLPILILAALLIIGFSVYSVRRKIGFPSLRNRVRVGIPLTIVWIVVVIVAIAFRLHDDTFLPWVGDMGAYVNWANELDRTGALTASWPPVFSSFLAISGGIFGSWGTTAGISLTGYLLIAVVARVLTRLKLNPWIVVGIAGALALNIHAIWYTAFPASESLNAPLFVVWIGLLVATLRAPKNQLVVFGILTFLVSLNLNLLRGSGSFVVAPLIVLGIFALCFGSWRRWAVPIWVYLFASLAAAVAGVWYGVARIPTYFVKTQVKDLIPLRLFTAAKSIGLLSATPLLVAVLVLLLVIAAFGIVLSRRLEHSVTERGISTTRVLGLLAAIVFLLAMIAVAVVGSNVWFILLRMGLWLVALAIVALVLLWRRRTLHEDTPVIFLTAAITLLLLALQVTRLGNNRPHAFFLYWDRYLVSEILPGLAILAAFGASLALAAIVEYWTSHERPVPAFGPRMRIALPVIITGVLVILTALPSIPILILESQDSYMAGADTFTSDLIAHADRSDGLLWGGTSTGKAPGFFFPNTWMAFAIPMHRSFGYTWLNVSQGHPNFGPDDVVSKSELTTDLATHSTLEVYEAQTGGPSLQSRFGSDFTITRVATEVSNISLLAQSRVLGHWTHLHLTVVIWKVTAAS